MTGGGLVLASASPRRREILSAAGIRFRVCPPAVEERRLGGEPPEAYAKRLAHEKAEEVGRREPGVILAADTVVVVGDEILEKPADEADALRMLRLLAGRGHLVITGIAIRHPRGEILDAERTTVHFSMLSEQEIRAYVATGEPMDKAGAYAIQGLASRYIERVEGCYFNVVGLPMARVYRHLLESTTTAGIAGWIQPSVELDVE